MHLHLLVSYSLIVASYRRHMGVIAVREMARHRYRQSQYAGLTRLQLDQVGQERQVQRLATGGGAGGVVGGDRAGDGPPGAWLSVCVRVRRAVSSSDIVLRSRGVCV